jgi:hypothetical protein
MPSSIPAFVAHRLPWTTPHVSAAFRAPCCSSELCPAIRKVHKARDRAYPQTRRRRRGCDDGENSAHHPSNLTLDPKGSWPLTITRELRSLRSTPATDAVVLCQSSPRLLQLVLPLLLHLCRPPVGRCLYLGAVTCLNCRSPARRKSDDELLLATAGKVCEDVGRVDVDTKNSRVR